MKHELFADMQKQMNPSPEVRADLSEKLARPAKKRPLPWKKYGALAACAALVIGAVGAYHLTSGQGQDGGAGLQPLHGYVTVEGAADYATENAAVRDSDTGGTEVNTGDLPGGAYVGDAPVQEGAEDYEKLMDHFNGTYPDWYGGAYLDASGRLVVQLVESEDPADKSLELQVLDWTGSDSVMFSSCKYSLAYLNELMEKLNQLPDTNPEYRKVMASWSVDVEANRVTLTLTEANTPLLSDLGKLDPRDDMILVQVGQRASTDDTKTEEPSVQHVVPGGDAVRHSEDLIADEPVYDGAHYDVEDLPAELPEQKQPALVEGADTPSYDPDAK